MGKAMTKHTHHGGGEQTGKHCSRRDLRHEGWPSGAHDGRRGARAVTATAT